MSGTSFLPSRIFARPLEVVDALFQSTVERLGGSIPSGEDELGVPGVFLPAISSFSDKVCRVQGRFLGIKE